MMTIFLVVVALITGYFLGLSRNLKNKAHSNEENKSKDGYSSGYYQAIKDIRRTAKILNNKGEAAPVDKVLTTLLGQSETPSYKNTTSSKSVAASRRGKTALQKKSFNTADLLPNITLVVGAVLILASASLFTVWIDQPIITTLTLILGVVIFFALAVKFTKLKVYIPAGLTFLALSIALIPVAISPIPDLTMVSQWIITSLVATAMLAYISRWRDFIYLPYVTTLSFFSLAMSLARGLTDDIFWSFVVVVVAAMGIYLLRLKKPLYIAIKFDTPAVLATTWVPAITAFASLYYLSDIGIEKLHVILALTLAYYLVVWLNSYRYVHELIAKVIGLALLSSITYEHIEPLGGIYVSLSFALIGIAMVASSLIGWKRANEKRYIFSYEVAWLLAGFAVLWYAYAHATVGSGNYIFAAVLALTAAALSVLATQISKRVWFNINAIVATAMTVVALSQWLIVIVGSWSNAYFIAACMMTAIGAYLLWVYRKTSNKAASYIAVGSVLFFAYLAEVYLVQSNIYEYRMPELLVAILGYMLARRQKWPVLYLISNLLIFYVSTQLVYAMGSGLLNSSTLLISILCGFAVLVVMAILQKEVLRKWTLATIVLLALPMYLIASDFTSLPGSFDTLRYVSLSILVIGTAAAHLLHIRPGAVRGVKVAHELTVYGLLLLTTEFMQLVDISSYIHPVVYAHMVAAALIYVSIYVYGESSLKKLSLIRQVIAAVLVTGSMAIYALEGTGLGQAVFLIEHAILLAIAMRMQIRWLVYWASVSLVLAALYILDAPASIMLFLVGAGLITLVVRSVSKNTQS